MRIFWRFKFRLHERERMIYDRYIRGQKLKEIAKLLPKVDGHNRPTGEIGVGMTRLYQIIHKIERELFEWEWERERNLPFVKKREHRKYDSPN